VYNQEKNLGVKNEQNIQVIPVVPRHFTGHRLQSGHCPQ
jgi:hypothetical protein